MIVGVMVTLRGQRMYDFLEKLLAVTLPRVRDFRGINSEAFDKNGNYNLGFKENMSFPEVKAEEIEKTHGLEVTICTSAKNKEDARKLLTNFGFPFKKR